MADYQRVVEYLRDIRSSPITQVDDELRQYAADYADLCRSANERLRQCTTFLQQGLRSEAIQLAEQSPNLLDLVAALDLPDASVWADLCQQFGLPLPAPLQMDRAAALNEAYAQDQSLEELLHRHRVLALARAPVKRRLEVMRQIAAIDGAAGFWEKDIRTFEKARIKEMRLEAQAAIRLQDAAAISDLQGEIEQNQWLEAIPADLQKAVGDSFAGMLKDEVEGNIQAPLAALREAYAARDYAQCSSLVGQIRQMLEAAGQQAVSTSIAMELQPIVQWVQQEAKTQARRQEMEEAFARFSSLLETSASADRLTATYRKLTEEWGELPQDVVQRYRAALAVRARSARRKLILRLGLGVAAAAAVLVLVYLFLQWQAARDWAKRISDANAARNPRLARQLIDEQEKRAPRLSVVPELASAKRQTADLEQKFGDASDKVKELFDAVLPVQTAADEVSISDSSTGEAILSAVARVDWAIGRIDGGRDVAWADGDDRLARGRAALVGLRARLVQVGNARLRREAEALDDQVEAVRIDGDAEAAAAALDTAQARAKAMLALPEAEAGIKETLSSLNQKVEDKRKLLDSRRQLQTELAALRARPASPDALREALTAFVGKFAAAPISKDFKMATDRIDLLKPVSAWAALGAGWESFVPTSAQQASARAAEVEKYLTDHPQSPYIAEVKAYAGYLKAAVDALGEKGTWRAALGDLLGNPMMAELTYVTTTDGRRYYTLGDIKRKEIPRVGTTIEVIDPKNLARRMAVTVFLPAQIATTRPVAAPHTQLAARLNDDVKQIDEHNWESWGADAIDRVLAAQQIDPVVQAILLQQMIKTNQQVVGWALPGVYEKADAALARLSLETVNWYDHEHPVTEGTKSAISKAVARIPTGTEIKTRYAQRKAELLKGLKVGVLGPAMLMRNANGVWTVYGPDSPPDGATAAVVLSANGASALVPVARAKAGQYAVDASAARDLPEGSLLLIMAP